MMPAKGRPWAPTCDVIPHPGALTDERVNVHVAWGDFCFRFLLDFLPPRDNRVITGFWTRSGTGRLQGWKVVAADGDVNRGNNELIKIRKMSPNLEQLCWGILPGNCRFVVHSLTTEEILYCSAECFWGWRGGGGGGGGGGGQAL